MNDFFVSFQAYRRNYLYWVGSFVIVCSCGLVGIKEAILSKLNESMEKDVDKVDKIIITSLTILDPLTAVQLTDNYTNDVLRIEDEGNSAIEQ